MYRNDRSISHAGEAAEPTTSARSPVASSTKPGNECWPRNRSPRRKIYKRQSIDSFEAAWRPSGGPAAAKRTGGQAAKRCGDALPWHLRGEDRFKLGSSRSAPEVLVPELGARTPYRHQPQPSMALAQRRCLDRDVHPGPCQAVRPADWRAIPATATCRGIGGWRRATRPPHRGSHRRPAGRIRPVPSPVPQPPPPPRRDGY